MEKIKKNNDNHVYNEENCKQLFSEDDCEFMDCFNSCPRNPNIKKEK